MRIEDKARQIVQPILEEHGYLLWDVVFEKEGAYHYLRILFDGKDRALDMDECEKLTPILNKALDESDFISAVDIVDIGSPGLSRSLRKDEHFAYAVGKPVKVKTRIEGGKTELAAGNLDSFDAETLTVSDKTIARKSVINASLDL